MNWFTKLFTKQYVAVEYRKLTQAKFPFHGTGYRYIFLWPMATPPKYGMWVRVPGGTGETTGVIVDISAAPQPGHAPKPVLGIVSTETIERATRG